MYHLPYNAVCDAHLCVDKQARFLPKEAAATIGFDKHLMGLDALNRCIPLSMVMWRMGLRKGTLERPWPIGYLEVHTPLSDHQIVKSSADVSQNMPYLI